MLRGKLWDDLTFGPTRRRRSMLRRLAALDRLDRLDRIGGPGRPGRRSDVPRRVMVGLTTMAVVLAVVVVTLEREWGVQVDRDGFHRRAALGAPPAVATGVGTFRFVATQRTSPDSPVAYDPCRPVDIVINDTLAPSGTEGMVETSVADVAAATGLHLRVIGRTDEPASADRPSQDLARYGSGWSPAIVGWTSPADVPRLAGRVAGVGGSTQWAGSMTATNRFVTGTVWLDAPQLADILRRPQGPAQVRAIVLHELGHLVGLDHVDDPAELMYEENVGVLGYGPGDREGLAALGSGSCA